MKSNMSFARPALAVSVMFGAAMCGSMALAQEAGTQGADIQEADAAQTVHAAPAPEMVRLDAITVSAEKTDRLLKYTASSVVVTDEEQLTEQGITSGNELLERIPNIVSVEPGNDAPTVRGLDGTGPASGANAFFAGTRPRFSYQVDGRTLGFNEAVFQNTSVWDVEQVEIYRGPQSTLQGRNAIAGTMAIKTADPTFEWESKARAIGGGQNTRVFSGVVSGPLIEDVLAFRVAADYQSHESDVEFTAYPEEADPGLYRNTTLRGKLLFTPTPDVRSLLTFSHVTGRSPQAEYVGVPYSDGNAKFPEQPTFLSRNGSIISDTTWDVSDLLSLQAYLAYTDFRTIRRTPAGTGNVEITGDEIVFEPRINVGNTGDQLSGFLAAYIFRTDQHETIDFFGGGHYVDETENNALYGEATFNATDAMSITLGARYEEEERIRYGAAGPLILNFNETYREFLPRATVTYDLNPAWTIGATVGRGYNGGGAGITFAPPFTAYTYDPEYVWNYEGFARAELMGGRLELTGNLFYNDYTDLQMPFILGVNSTVIRNAEKATTYGFEAGARYLFAERSEVYINAGLLQTKVDRYNDPLIEGNDLARSPAFTTDIGFSWAVDDSWVIAGDARFTDAYYSDAANSSARGKIDPYVVANAQVSYKIGDARLFVNATNLFDNDSVTNIVQGTTAADDYATVMQPRLVTAGIEFNF